MVKYPNNTQQIKQNIHIIQMGRRCSLCGVSSSGKFRQVPRNPELLRYWISRLNKSKDDSERIFNEQRKLRKEGVPRWCDKHFPDNAASVPTDVSFHVYILINYWWKNSPLQFSLVRKRHWRRWRQTTVHHRWAHDQKYRKTLVNQFWIKTGEYPTSSSNTTSSPFSSS